MNTVLSKTTSDPLSAAHSALDGTYRRRADARIRPDNAARALARGHALLEDAKKRLDIAERAASAERDVQTRKLVKTLADSDRLVAVPTESDPTIARELTQARHGHAVATQACETLQATLTEAQAELSAAETAVESAVDAYLAARAESVAAKIDTLLTDIIRLSDELERSLRSGISSVGYLAMSPQMTTAMEISNYLHERDALHTPVSILRDRQYGVNGYPAERARLIAGEPNATAKVVNLK